MNPMRILSSFFSLAVIGMWLVVGTPALAAEKDAAADAAVRKVIRSQLDAFGKNDFKTAYGFAHSGIKGQFTRLQFEQMVRGSFPQMLNPKDVFIGGTDGDEKGAEAQVILTDEKGNRSGFQYHLEKENGEWRITAVIPIELVEPLV